MAKLKWSGSIAAYDDYKKLRKQIADKKKLAIQSKKKKRKKGEKNSSKPIRRWWKTYEEYLASNWWKGKRKQKLKSVGYKCQSCGKEDNLQVHHLHYKSLGREKHSDLKVLCAGCHTATHEITLQADSHLRSINNVID